MLQEVYLTVWRKAGDFDPAGQPDDLADRDRAQPRHRPAARRRAAARRMEPIEAAAEVADAAPDAERAAGRRAGRSALHGCLGELAAHERGALRGAFFDGNTYEELAAAHGRAARHDEELDPPRDDAN